MPLGSPIRACMMVTPHANALVHIQAITPGPSLDHLAAVLMSAADDPALDNTHAPRVHTRQQVETWWQQCGWTGWVIYADTAPVGYIALHDPQLTDAPEIFCSHRESDEYLVPAWRGYRVMSAAWKLVDAQVPAGTAIVAEVWETNTSSIRRLQRDGWTARGRYQWRSSSGDQSGWCQRFTRIVR